MTDQNDIHAASQAKIQVSSPVPSAPAPSSAPMTPKRFADLMMRPGKKFRLRDGREVVTVSGPQVRVQTDTGLEDVFLVELDPIETVPGKLADIHDRAACIAGVEITAVCMNHGQPNSFADIYLGAERIGREWERDTPRKLDELRRALADALRPHLGGA